MPLPTHAPGPPAILVVVLLLSALCAGSTRAEVLLENGSRIHVNDSPATDQASHADVTIEESGSIVVAYLVDFNETWVRRYDGAGTPVGPEKLVATTGFTKPRVIPGPAPPISPSPSSGRTAASAPGSWLLFSTAGALIQALPFRSSGDFGDPSDLTISEDGTFSVSKNNQVFFHVAAVETFGHTFYGRYLDDREPLTGAFLSYENGGSLSPQTASICRDTSSGGAAPRTPAPEPDALVAEIHFDGDLIQGRLLDATGSQIGGVFPISPPSPGQFKIDLTLATNRSGIAMVVWQEVTGRQLLYALVDGQGLLRAALPLTTSFGAWQPDVAALGDFFVVTWRQEGVNSAPDTIQARFLDVSDPAAPVLGPEVEVSGPAPSGGRHDPAVGSDGRETLVIVWTEASPDLTDSDVLAQRLRLVDPIFVDGFESGSTSAWSP